LCLQARPLTKCWSIKMKHTISVIVENKPGVLHRVSALFSRRGFNIESLAVGTTADPDISRMTIVASGDDQTLEQIIKQLYKLIDVLKVFDLPELESIERELAMVKVKADQKTQTELTQIADTCGAKIVNVAADSVIIEISAEQDKVENLQRLLEKFDIIELVRTGKIALQRGSAE